MSDEPEVIDEDEDVFLEDEDGEEPAGDLEDQLEAALTADDPQPAAAERPANVPLLAVVGADGVWRLPSEPPGTPAAGGEAETPSRPSNDPPAPPLSEEGAMALLAEIWKLNDDVQEVRQEMALRRAQFKSSKADLDSLLERLAELTDRKKAIERAKEERLPLLDARPAGNGSPATVGPSVDASPAEPPPADPDAWRKAPLSDLVLPAAILSRLEDNDVHTVGQLEDLRASGKGLAGIKGFGPAKITTIEDAVVHWLSKNRDKDVLAAAAAGPEAPAVEGGGA